MAETIQSMSKCPACNGDGGSIRVVGLGPTASGDARLMRCTVCQGEGEIPGDWAEFLTAAAGAPWEAETWNRR